MRFIIQEAHHHQVAQLVKASPDSSDPLFFCTVYEMKHTVVDS